MIAILLISAFLAWRYSKTSVDPDWSYFNLWGFTGSVYGRDFADCKTPLVHLWYLGLSKLVGRNIARVRFANHFLVGSVGVLLYVLTGNFWGAVAYTVLVNSGWLLAYHGNVGQIPAALIAVALTVDTLPASLLWLLAVLYEPKLAPSFLVFVVLSGSYFALAVLAFMVFFAYYHKDREPLKGIWESSVTIPLRMNKNRKGDFYKLFMPWFTSTSVLYLLPWLAFAIQAKPDVWYWLPALVYVVLIASGKVVRQNHFIPIIPFVAMSGLPFVPLLVVIDLVSNGFYLGNIWARHYPALDEINDTAEKIGAWFQGKPGTLYVNDIHSGVYIHTRKPVLYGFAEQIEIRETAHERRKVMIEGWKQNPPDWVVNGRFPGMSFKPVGYQRMAIVGDAIIYKKMT